VVFKWEEKDRKKLQGWGVSWSLDGMVCKREEKDRKKLQGWTECHTGNEIQVR